MTLFYLIVAMLASDGTVSDEVVMTYNEPAPCVAMAELLRAKGADAQCQAVELIQPQISHF